MRILLLRKQQEQPEGTPPEVDRWKLYLIRDAELDKLVKQHVEKERLLKELEEIARMLGESIVDLGLYRPRRKIGGMDLDEGMRASVVELYRRINLAKISLIEQLKELEEKIIPLEEEVIALREGKNIQAESAEGGVEE